MSFFFVSIHLSFHLFATITNTPNTIYIKIYFVKWVTEIILLLCSSCYFSQLLLIHHAKHNYLPNSTTIHVLMHYVRSGTQSEHQYLVSVAWQLPLFAFIFMIVSFRYVLLMEYNKIKNKK